MKSTTMRTTSAFPSRCNGRIKFPPLSPMMPVQRSMGGGEWIPPPPHTPSTNHQYKKENHIGGVGISSWEWKRRLIHILNRTQTTTLQGFDTKVESQVGLTETVLNMALYSRPKRPSILGNTRNYVRFSTEMGKIKGRSFAHHSLPVGQFMKNLGLSRLSVWSYPFTSVFLSTFISMIDP